MRFKLIASVVIGIDCIGSYKSNYHTITATTAPYSNGISGLGNAEVQPQLSRMFTEQNRTGFLSTESEELNRALVLTLARAVHVNGKEMKQH
jgi:hypothetical protein